MTDTVTLQVPFAKFLIPVPDTLHTVGVETRTSHFAVEVYFNLPILINWLRLVRVPFFTAFTFVGDVNLT